MLRRRGCGFRGCHFLTDRGTSPISIGHMVRARQVWPRPEGMSPWDQGLTILAIGGMVGGGEGEVGLGDGRLEEGGGVHPSPKNRPNAARHQHTC